ncbi:MAG: hypothetical protein J7578_15350 [Chitinophagaceae bacterium]|nr:hypothetical protein [Chitinophagaceae bacterium]
MSDCQNLVHPFQTDPGVNQAQRKIDDLLSGSASIDGRTMADLLTFFAELSKHVNYYDENLQKSDWQPFFKKSLPFTIAGMVNFNKNKERKKFDNYQSIFNKKPTRQRLQLIRMFVFDNTFQRIDQWYQQVKGSGLPIEQTLVSLIRDKLQKHLTDFILYNNAITFKYGLRKIDFSSFLSNPHWSLKADEIYNSKEPAYPPGPLTNRKRLTAFKDAIVTVYTLFQDLADAIALSSSQSMNESIEPLKEELKQHHPPHLGLLFAFLKLFTYLQQDLNGFTRKHLDFFYRDVLKLAPRKANPDKAHIVFDIQKHLDKYLLKKGLLLKDGKDANKQEILFALDDEIVVNKAQVADLRTLHLNQEIFAQHYYTEGFYMAPAASKADGIDIDFKDNEPKNWYTLGNKFSKYRDPDTKYIRPYPNARMGFMLSSPVLLLQEGKRIIDIKLACTVDADYCGWLKDEVGTITNRCCDDPKTDKPTFVKSSAGNGCRDANLDPVKACKLFGKVKDLLNKKFYYITEALIQQAIKKGIGKDTVIALRKLLNKDKPTRLCYCPVQEQDQEKLVPSADFEAAFGEEERKSLLPWFAPQGIFTIRFTGEKEWIEPSSIESITMDNDNIVCDDAGTPNPFMLNISVTMQPDKPAITFFNEQALKEDYDIILPTVRIELNDKIKLKMNDAALMDTWESDPTKGADDCCLDKRSEGDIHFISLYHFFRNVKLVEDGTRKTTIHVEVTGVKNVIVQNDENILNVNAPLPLFGVRPKVGSSFFIGSKEVFGKNWQEFSVNVEWKDKPTVNFSEYYKHYKYEKFEDGQLTISDNSFKVNASLLDHRQWKGDLQKLLFKAPSSNMLNEYQYTPSDFGLPAVYIPRPMDPAPLQPLNINTSDNFLRMTLRGVSFQHDRYAFVLARHMISLAQMVDPISINGAIGHVKDAKELAVALEQRINAMIPKVNGLKTIIDNMIRNTSFDAPGPTPNLALDGIRLLLNSLTTRLGNASGFLGAADIPNAITEVNAALNLANAISNRTGNAGATGFLVQDSLDAKPLITDIDFLGFNDPDNNWDTADKNVGGVRELIHVILAHFTEIEKLLKVNDELKGDLPKEPYTPTLRGLSINYKALANSNDIALTHLHPFDGTYKPESILKQPTLFPSFCDEGSLYIGLKDLVPGSNLTMLFQLAEATADSESERENVRWYYLSNNQWKLLRKGFDILNDGTDGLTTSGVIKFVIPESIDTGNTIMPGNLHWIKAAILIKSASVSEVIGIHTQAVSVTFTNDDANDKQRLQEPLKEGSIAKLKDADASVKKVWQPYDAFGGQVPEEQGQYYQRVSELLRHKDRAIQKWDYERLVLEAFPQLYCVKCINHTYGLDANQFTRDFTIAPGYVLLGVIPDINKLQSGGSFEPRVPVSLLEQITEFLKKRTSPFVRLKVMNPRYEEVNICMKVKFYLGKDENYYKEKLQQDLREFVAPWSLGNPESLRFAQCLNRSDFIRFLETRDYVDYITDLRMVHEEDESKGLKDAQEVCPKTPRSILIAGKMDICIQQDDCEKWDPCGNAPEGEQRKCCEQPPYPLTDYCKPGNTKAPIIH